MRRTFIVVTVGALAAFSPARATSPAAQADADRASAKACLAAAALRNANVGPVARYSDDLLIDARVVTGTWPQPHMRGARATLLCLHNRRTGRAEVQELAPTVPAKRRA